MPAYSNRGPIGLDPQRPIRVIDGTLSRSASPKPVSPLREVVSSWPISKKLIEAAKRAGPRLPVEMRDQFSSLFTPKNMAVTSAALIAFGATQLIPIAGEAEDLAILGLGVFFLGPQAFQVGYELGSYMRIAAAADSEADLERAANYLAAAVVAVGITAFMSMIFSAAGRIGRGRAPGTGDSATVDGTLESQQGDPGPWWKATDFGEDYPGTRVPRGFRIQVGGREFRVHPNACKHMVERLKSSVKTSYSKESWPRSPWLSEVDYPISSLAGALEQAIPRLKGLPLGQQRLVQGNWELGIDTASSPWVVFHARPLIQ